MDGNNNLNMHNWGYNVPATSFESHLGLPFMSSMPQMPMLGGHNVSDSSTITNGALHHRGIEIPQAAYPVDYMRDAWLNNQRESYMNVMPANPSYGGIPGTSSAPHGMQTIQPIELSMDERPMEEAHVVVEREKFMNTIPTNLSYAGIPGTSSAQHHMQMIQPTELSNDERPIEEAPVVVERENVSIENGQSSNPSIQRAPRVSKQTVEIVINGINVDISTIPIPFCSCTGIPRKCYKWGNYGWQSVCCTKDLSVYPLPWNPNKRRCRIYGRKMSVGAFKKVIEKLAAEGYNFSNPIDLKIYWAKHGTNKFVTIR